MAPRGDTAPFWHHPPPSPRRSGRVDSRPEQIGAPATQQLQLVPSQHSTNASLLPPASPYRRSAMGSASASPSGHAHSHSVASSAASTSLNQIQPTRSGRLPIPPRQEELDAMLAMENYFEFPSESESDDEDFVPPSAGVDQDPDGEDWDEDTPLNGNNDGQVSVLDQHEAAEPSHRSSRRKGKGRATDFVTKDVGGRHSRHSHHQNEAGYSSATEAGTIDNAEWEWLMDQMKTIESGSLPSFPEMSGQIPSALPPQEFHHENVTFDLDCGSGEASEEDADNEDGSSPVKEGDFDSPAGPGGDSAGVDVAGLVASKAPDWDVQLADAARARHVFSVEGSTDNHGRSTTSSVPQLPYGQQAHPQNEQDASLSSSTLRAAGTGDAITRGPSEAGEGDHTKKDNSGLTRKLRAANGKFTKATKRGKNKAVVEERYAHDADAWEKTAIVGKQRRKNAQPEMEADSLTQHSHGAREDSAMSLPESDMAPSMPPPLRSHQASAAEAAARYPSLPARPSRDARSVSVLDDAEKPESVDPYTTIVPRKRGRAAVPLSPGAEAAQAELRRARRNEQSEEYRERKKLKQGNWEARIALLEEEKTMLADENRLLRAQVETLKQERERDRKMWVEASVSGAMGAQPYRKAGRKHNAQLRSRSRTANPVHGAGPSSVPPPSQYSADSDEDSDISTDGQGNDEGRRAESGRPSGKTQTRGLLGSEETGEKENRYGPDGRKGSTSATGLPKGNITFEDLGRFMAGMAGLFGPGAPAGTAAPMSTGPSSDAMHASFQPPPGPAHYQYPQSTQTQLPVYPHQQSVPSLAYSSSQHNQPQSQSQHQHSSSQTDFGSEVAVQAMLSMYSQLQQQQQQQQQQQEQQQHQGQEQQHQQQHGGNAMNTTMGMSL